MRTLMHAVFMVCAFLFMADELLAQRYQRMGIPRGNYTLRPRSSKAVPSYCMDYSLKAPKQGVLYENVAAGGDAVVRIGDEVLTLEEAIAARKIAIEGTNSSFESLMNRLPEMIRNPAIPTQERQMLTAMKREWDRMTPAQRALVLQDPEIAALDRALREAGDHTRLQIKNLTNDPLTVELRRSCVLTNDQMPGRKIHEGILESSQGGTIDRQNRVWNSEYQQILTDVGLYDGTIDGVLGPQSARAIRQFQQEHRLSPTGAVNKATEKLLRQKERIRVLGEQNEHCSYINVEFNAAKSQYRLDLGDKGYSYVGNDVTELITKLNEQVPNRNAYYMNLSGFTPAREEAFLTSCRMSQRSISEVKSIHSLKKTNRAAYEVTELQDAFLSKKVKPVSQSEIIERGDKFAFEATFKNTYNKHKNWLLSVASRSREVTQTYWNKFKQLFTPNKYSDLSIADAVSIGRRDVQQALGLESAEATIEFGTTELRGQFVMIYRYESFFYAMINR